MILPMIVYGLSNEEQNVLFSVLNELSQETQTPFRVQLTTTNITDAVAAVDRESGIATILIGVSSLREDKQKLALRLGKMAIQRNRDHYVVYIVKNRQELELILPLCARSSGMLICPLQEKAIRHIFKPVLEDYHQIYKDESSQDGQWINLKSSGKVYRIRLNDVSVVQAVGKMIEFHTSQQDIAVYSSMDSVEKMLSSDFLRCHRSYFVNTRKIQYIDFREMNICLMDGSTVPLARSFKESMTRNFAPDLS